MGAFPLAATNTPLLTRPGRNGRAGGYWATGEG